MSYEEHQSSTTDAVSKYDYEFVGGLFQSYFFQTNVGIIYEVIFKPTGYIFKDDTFFKDNIFEFSIIVAENPTKKTPPLDKLIPDKYNVLIS